MSDQHISSNSEIGRNNQFGHGVVIRDDVRIGDDNVFGDYVSISGNTRIGSGNHIGDHVSIGRIPTNSRIKYEFQQAATPDERFGEIVIGDRNVIREFTNVGLPTLALTAIQNDCYIMPHCHIAHDVLLEDRVILANHCSPGGHTRILKGASLGKNVHIHPRTIVGQYAMLGIGSVVIRNVLPAVTAVGNPAQLIGVNSVGLERNGFSSDDIHAFTALLTSSNDTFIDSDVITPRVRDVMDHFLDLLPSARDRRTLPGIDLTRMSRAV